MKRNRLKNMFFIAIVFAASIFAPLLIFRDVRAADLRNFNPGHIISDTIFTNSDTMSVAQIQEFLNSKVKCDNFGAKPSELGGGTRAQWLRSKGYSTPIRCITDYMENPSTGENNYGKYETPTGAVSAAQLIYNYSKQFGINPQVLIVTLQKENGMITDEWPTLKQFREAMGFGCPDNVAPGAPACDPSYGSFSSQLYQAARHFRGYMERRSGWFVPYKIGWNKIMWSPKATCGTSDVYIENAATVALYSYTPYRPNQAALNAGYGLGDSCSSYGNRNFYSYFNDWFGSTNINGSLLRSVNDATVYLVGDGVKYPIASVELLSSLSSVLGNVSFVSDSYLASIKTGHFANRLIIDKSGTIFFFASGIKLPFTSCGLVADYGYNCGEAMKLTESQLIRFSTGPIMHRGMRTADGRTFYVKDGQKREIFDEESVRRIDSNFNLNVLGNDSISHLPFGMPIIKDNVIIGSKSERYLYFENKVVKIRNSVISDYAFADFQLKNLHPESLSKIAKSGEISNFVSGSKTTYILTSDGKKILNSYQADYSKTVVIPDAAILKIRGTGALSTPALVKSFDNGTVYAIINNQKRPLVSMDDLESITGEKNPFIAWLDNEYIRSIPDGNVVIGVGRLVKAPSNGTVYMSDGIDGLIPMTSFIPAIDLGINMNVRIISDNILSKDSIRKDSILSQYISCGGVNYLGISSQAYQTNISYRQPLTLDQKTCNVIHKNQVLPKFIQDINGTIFYNENGILRPISSFSKYVELASKGGELKKASIQVMSMLKIGGVI